MKCFVVLFELSLFPMRKHMSSARVGVSSFLIQAESVREEIKTNFLRSHQILAVKESAILSKLDQLIARYKGVRVNRQIEELNRKKEFIENVENNENQETVVKSVAVMDSRISELKTSQETTVARMRSVELRWDGELEKKLNQIGWIWFENGENIQNQTSSRLGEYCSSSSDEEYDSSERYERQEESKEQRQNPYFLPNPETESSIVKSLAPHGVLITAKCAIGRLSLQDGKEFYEAKTMKYKEHKEKSRSDLEEMREEFEQYKMKYGAHNTKLLQMEKKLNVLRTQRPLYSSGLIGLGDLIRSTDSNMSNVSSIKEEFDSFPVDITSPPPKFVIDKNKLEYLPAPDSLSIRNLSEIANVPSDIKGNELKCYSPNVLKQYINLTSTLIYKRNSIKTINLSLLKNPGSHTDKQVFIEVRETCRLGNLKVIFSKKLPYLSKSEMIAGIRLQEPYGNSNGVHDSVKHFDCPPKHAVFIPINEVFVPVF